MVKKSDKKGLQLQKKGDIILSVSCVLPEDCTLRHYYISISPARSTLSAKECDKQVNIVHKMTG